jgi:hypothetical protein
MSGWTIDGAECRFLASVKSVLSFAHPGKFEVIYFYIYPAPFSPRKPVNHMTSDELLDCDAELKAAVRALKANMHAVRSLAELAHDCVVANDLAAALEGLELAPLSHPPEL